MKKMLIWLQTVLKKRKWYIILLVLSSIYVIKYRYDIFELKEINAMNLVFLLWLFLLLFPLISELEFLGIKIKKVVDKETSEIKKDVDGLRQQIAIAQNSNAIANSINLSYGIVPSRQEIEDKKNQTNDNLIEEQDWYKSIDENSALLFKIRYAIESSLRKICREMEIDNRQPTYRVVKELKRKGIIDYDTMDSIMKVTGIANRGIHGEIVSSEYMEYVKEAVPRIFDRLKRIELSMGNYGE